MARLDVRTLAALQRGARADGRVCVVGAVIVDGDRAFVQRRSSRAALFPGCWDIVGGHVEPGESLVAAVAREVTEETGWRLEHLGALLHEFDWEYERGGRTWRVREFDFMAEVVGDLNVPRLEVDKFSEARWVDASTARSLMGDQGVSGAMLELVIAALEGAGRDDVSGQART